MTPTIMVGIILETRGKVPLEDEPSEPPVTQRLYKPRICLDLNPEEPCRHPTLAETVDKVPPFGKLISPVGSSLWQSILPIGIA